VIVIKRYVNDLSKDIYWYWLDRENNKPVSELFDSFDEAIVWANERYDKVHLDPTPDRVWSGRDRRKGPIDRRSGLDRRTEIRYELTKNDRRKSVGRRSEDYIVWDNILTR
jgi:hypothetical protein